MSAEGAEIEVLQAVFVLLGRIVLLEDFRVAAILLEKVHESKTVEKPQGKVLDTTGLFLQDVLSSKIIK